jgi:PAS domain S-box-containing protein
LRARLFIEVLAVVVLAQLLVTAGARWLPGGESVGVFIRAGTLGLLIAPILWLRASRDARHWRREWDRASRLLAHSSWRYQSLVEGTGIIVWEYDPATRRFTYVSPQAARLGYPLERWREPGFWESILHPEDRDWVVAQCQEKTRAGCDHRFQYRMLRADGGVLWVDDIVSIVRTGESRGLLRGAFIDITDHHQTREALRAATEDARLLAAAIDAHADPVILTDARGVIRRVNPAFERLTGWTRQEAIGRHTRVLRSGRTPRHVYEDLWRTITSGRPWSGRLCNRRRLPARPLPILGQGTPELPDEFYWVELTITPVKNAEGKIEAFVAMHRDVTRAVLTEEAERLRLRDAEARLEVVKALAAQGSLKVRLDAALDAVFAMPGLDIQKKGGIFLLEPGDSHLRMFTHRGAFTEAFLREEAAVPLGRCLCGRAAQSGQILVSDNCFTDPRHENHWTNMTLHGHYIVPLMDRSTVPPVTLGVLFLYTEPNPVATPQRLAMLHEIGEAMATAILQDRAATLAQVARLRAEESSRAKSEFLANMSHEIRTPLTAILGFADILHERLRPDAADASVVDAVRTMRQAGQHLQVIINDILDLSRIEAGRLALESVEFSLPDLLTEVADLVRPRLTGRPVQLVLACDSPIPRRIRGDPTRLRQILLNLAGNAAKFTEQGSITLTARAMPDPPSPTLQIDIADTGIGIPPDKRDGLFQPFSQTDASHARRHGGTGLGLAISARLASLMNGSVELLHSQPGRGSCFRVTLPLDVPPDTAWSRSLKSTILTDRLLPESQPGTLHARILIAEDSPDIQRLIRHILHKAGATLDLAPNGRAALDMIERARAAGHDYDLLLTDMQMPEMDGYSLVRTLRARGWNRPIIALTAHAMAEDRDRCLAAGCNDYVSKPIDRVTLLAACAAALRHASPLRRSA